MKSRIHLIRHGITEGVQKRWFYGHTDIPLVEEGIADLEELKAKGTYPEVSDAEFYTSGMLRANQSLQVIYGDVPYTAIPLLKEINFGRWECKSYDELTSEPEHDAWMADRDGSFTYPGGESIRGFYERIGEGFKELMSYHCRDGAGAVSVVVCHGGAIASTMDNLFPGTRENFWKWIPAPGRGFTVEFEDGKAVSYSEI